MGNFQSRSPHILRFPHVLPVAGRGIYEGTQRMILAWGLLKGLSGGWVTPLLQAPSYLRPLEAGGKSSQIEHERGKKVGLGSNDSALTGLSSGRFSHGPWALDVFFIFQSVVSWVAPFCKFCVWITGHDWFSLLCIYSFTFNGWFEVKVTYTHMHALTDTDTNPKQASTYPYYVPRNVPILFYSFF